MKRITIVGLGYIGLPTAIQAAQVGFDVYGYDIDHEKVKNIIAGNPTIFEPELTERLWKVLKSGFFKAGTELGYADCFIVAVPTPFKENKTADLTHVYHAGEAISKRLMPGNLVILESTVPVGTTEKLSHILEEGSGLKLGIDFFVAYCPERVLPGKIFRELVENDRIIGGICQRSCDLAYRFYSKFVKGMIHITDDKTAEMVKLVENTSRDIQIAFANQIAEMCRVAGIDAYDVIDLANKHPRVKILSPTCGVGGHCIAVDPWFLIETFPEHSDLLRTARTINDNKPQLVIQQILGRVNDLKALGITTPKVLALGLSFKPDVDDIRESPALAIAKYLARHNDMLDLRVYDKNVAKRSISDHGLTTIDDLRQAIAWSDIIVFLVKHREFLLIREEDFDNKIILDTCGLLHDMRQKQSRALLDATKIKQDFWE